MMARKLKLNALQASLGLRIPSHGDVGKNEAWAPRSLMLKWGKKQFKRNQKIHAMSIRQVSSSTLTVPHILTPSATTLAS